MIVLTKEQKEAVKGRFGIFKELNPIEIQNNEFVLSNEILSDNDYESIFDILLDCYIKQIDEIDFIEYEIEI